MAIVTYRPKRSPRRKQQPPAAVARPVTVTAKHPQRGSRFGDVPKMTPEEHQRRGAAAEALWRELVRRASE